MKPVSCNEKALVFAIGQIDHGHFLARLDVVGLRRLDALEQDKRVVHIAATQQQVDIGDRDARLLARAGELAQRVLDHLGRLVLHAVEQEHVGQLQVHRRSVLHAYVARRARTCTRYLVGLPAQNTKYNFTKRENVWRITFGKSSSFSYLAFVHQAEAWPS